jgi:hypothetical protein
MITLEKLQHVYFGKTCATEYLVSEETALGVAHLKSMPCLYILTCTPAWYATCQY